MNNSLTTLFFILTFMLSSLAQAAPKIASVDFTKIFGAYYKLDELAQEIQVIRDRVAADRRITTLQEINDKRDQLIADSKDETKDEALKKSRLDEMAKLRDQYQELRLELEAYRREITSEVNELNKVRFDAYTKVIEAATTAYAEKNGFDWVIDSSGNSNTRLPAFLYVKNATDISEEIIAIINKDAPPKEPAAETPDADASTLPTNDSPTPTN